MVWATSGNKFLHAYSDSYKNFKRGFLCLEAGKVEASFWQGAGGNPKFSLEWKAEHYMHSFEYCQCACVHLSEADLKFRRTLLDIMTKKGLFRCRELLKGRKSLSYLEGRSFVILSYYCVSIFDILSFLQKT